MQENVLNQEMDISKEDTSQNVTAINTSKNFKDALPFYAIIGLGYIFYPLLMRLMWYTSYIVVNIFDDLPINISFFSDLNIFTILGSYTIWVPIIFLLVLLKKIDVRCCDVRDVIIWLGIFGVLRVAVKLLSTEVLNYSYAYAGANYIISYSTSESLIHTINCLWCNICFVFYLLIKSKSVKFHVKSKIILGSILIILSFIFFIFSREIAHAMCNGDVNVYTYSVRIIGVSTMFLWLRYFIYFEFLCLLSKQKIGYICGAVCLFIFTTFPLVFKLLIISISQGVNYQNIGLLELGDTIAYVIAAMVILGAGLINTYKKNH